MAQYEMNLRDYWMIVRRRRVIIVIATLAVMALSFWLSKQKVQVFQASSAVKFEQSASLSGLLVEVLSYSSADNIETQAALIRSYSILEEVAKRTGAVPAGKDAMPRDSNAYRSAIETVGGKVRTNRVAGTAIIEITATSTDARETAELANTVAEVYRDNNRQLRNARIVEARKYIETQLRDIEDRLKKSEDSMWAFRDEKQIVSPGAESSVLVSLFTQLRVDIERARQQRSEMESIQARLAGDTRSPSQERIVIDSANPGLTKLQSMQVDLLMERSTLTLELTEKHPRVQALDDRLREVRREMRREVTAQIAHLEHREEILNQQLQEVFRRNRAVPAVELGLNRLQREQKSNDDLAALLKTKRQEALIKEAEVIEEVVIIRPATEPEAPLAAQTFNTVIVGAFLGLVLGLVLAFIQETLDTSIGTIEDVETYLEVPVLGVVPHIDTRATIERLVERRPSLTDMDADALASHALLITHFDPKSPVAEAYRTLRTKIQFARMDRMAKTIVVTSPSIQEGKTTTIVNLALTMAQNGQKTLLVGSNLRRPSIHRFFGIEREPGLSDILIGNAEWRDCIRTVSDMLMGRFEMEDIMASPGLDNLHIIEAGPVPANPSELLSTSAMGEFLRAVREEYDIVLIDTPPVLPVTDSTIVAGQVDAVVLVYQAGKVGRLVLKRAKIHLESARARVLGVVLNDVQTEVAGYQYAHHYTHYYGEESSAPAAPPSRVSRLWQLLRGRADRRRGSGSGGSARPSRPSRSPRSSRASRDAARPRADTRASAGRGNGYRNTTLGVVLVATLATALAGALAWRVGRTRAVVPPRPREALRERFETPRSALAPVVKPVSRAAMPSASPSTPPTVEPVAAVMPSASVATNGAGAGYALELGPFASATEAEHVERRVNDAGFPTLRVRQAPSGDVYVVLVERIATPPAGEALVGMLREQGFADARLVDDDAALAIRVGRTQPLRGAVSLAERLRALGHSVRVASQPGERESFVVRHGAYRTREEASAKGEALKRVGLAPQVVRLR